MCLVVFAWQPDARTHLLVAANRDEFHRRPAEPLHWWPDRPEVLAGRDLAGGGTWLALGRRGRFATVTNYREQEPRPAGARSRGELVADFAAGDQSPGEFANGVDGDRYAGFNLLLADDRELCYLSNRGDAPRSLAPGVYGLSNASLDAPWTKLVRARAGLERQLASSRTDDAALFQLLGDRTPAPEPDGSTAHLPPALQRAISAPFIVTPDYGTRASSLVVWLRSGEIRVVERRFDPNGSPAGEDAFSFQANTGQPAP